MENGAVSPIAKPLVSQLGEYNFTHFINIYHSITNHTKYQQNLLAVRRSAGGLLFNAEIERLLLR